MKYEVTKWERCLDHHAEHGLVGNPLHQWDPFSGRERELIGEGLNEFGLVGHFCPKRKHLQNAG